MSFEGDDAAERLVYSSFTREKKVVRVLSQVKFSLLEHIRKNSIQISVSCEAKVHSMTCSKP